MEDKENKQAGNESDTAADEQEQAALEQEGNESGTSADTDKRLAELEAQLAKEKDEKEIYKNGLLALKEKTKTTKEQPKEQDSEAKRLVEELNRAIESSSSSGDGSGTGVKSNVKPVKPKGALSEAQIAEASDSFRKMGFDEGQVETMMKRYEANYLKGGSQVNLSHVKKRLH